VGASNANDRDRAGLRVLQERVLESFYRGRAGERVNVAFVEIEQLGCRLDIRRVTRDANGAWTPGVRGVSLRLEWVPRLIRAIRTFERLATVRQLRRSR